MFKKFVRTNIAEMRPVTLAEIDNMIDLKISISAEDAKNGSPKAGDMVARNPENHNDQWLVAKKYFNSNFKELVDD